MPVEEALARVLASVPSPLDEERVPLAEAFGRTLARDVAARRSQPPFANSAMDGYALRAADAAGLRQPP
jgi:molybdopterin molybdotransferase